LELGAGFNPEFTGRENVYLNGAILGLTRKEMDDRLDAIVAFADLGEFFDQPVKTYSSGMYVRLAFAVIAHIDAEILVIDEALAVGDAVFAQKCMRFLRRFKERGTIIFVSHDTGAVINLCRRALWLHAGQTVMLGSAKQVVESYLKAAMQASQGQDFTPALESHASTAEAAGAREPEASVEEAAPPSTSRPTAAAPFTFDPDAPSFGKGGASIEAAEVLGEDCKPLSLIRGGEYARLRITIRANEDIDGVIVGFLLKDRLGQVLFGANTFLETVGRPVNLAAGETATADLGFEMPHLQTGTYAIDLAVAEGTLDAHVQHQWFYDAVIVEIVATDAIYGLMRPRRAQASLVKCAVDDVGDVSGAASRKVTAS
jgi:lipopolysaccharide transport system ATP-binding protein